METPTAGTGSGKTTERKIVGVDHCNADLSNDKNLLNQFYWVTLDEVRNLSGWLVGDKYFSLTTSTNMKIKVLDPNVAGNLGLVNQYKNHLRQISGAINFIFKNHMKRTS